MEAKAQVVPKLDVASPISVTSDTVVVINGKKCVLRVDPDNNHLVAYPFKTEGSAIILKETRTLL